MMENKNMYVEGSLVEETKNGIKRRLIESYDRCYWTVTNNEFFENQYKTSCGFAPESKIFLYCPYCGRYIVVDDYRGG